LTQRRTDKDFERLLAHASSAVRGHRTALGLTQAQLGEKADLTDKFISRVETEGENLTLSSLSSIANALQVRAGDLLPRSTDQAEHPVARQCKALIESVGDDQGTLTMMLDLLRAARKGR
jgi:transcriptional regulator with XRE-family HTH domain